MTNLMTQIEKNGILDERKVIWHLTHSWKLCEILIFVLIKMYVAEPCKLLFLFLTCTCIWFICDLYSLWKIEREIILKNIKIQIFYWTPCKSEPFNNDLSWHTLIVIVHASVESQYMYWTVSSIGQLISECLLDVLNFPKKQQKNWQISALEYKKWLNHKIKAHYNDFDTNYV